MWMTALPALFLGAWPLQQSDAVQQATELNAVSLFFQTLKSMIAGFFSRKG